MFDSIGKDLDEEANARQAKSVLLASLLVAVVSGVIVAAGAWTVREVLLEEFDDEDLIELSLEDEMEMEAPPPPPPPPPPPAAASDAEEEDVKTESEELDEVEELEEEVEDKVRSDVKPAGVEGGVEGGVAGGVVGGVQGGVEGGVIGGQLSSGPRTFHHSELEVKKRVQPSYPSAAKGLGLGEQRCKVRMFIDEEGVPYDAKVEDCPKVFHEAAREGLMKWRWYSPRDGTSKIKAQTLIVVRFMES